MSIVVEKGKPKDLSESGVRISRSEALAHQWKLIQEWKPKSDVWAFRHGPPLLSALSAVSAFLIASNYRNRLKLRHFGQLYMFIPTIIVPTFLIPPAHMKFVSEEILLYSSCPVCIQLRSIATQTVGGILYPLILGPITGFMLSTMFATYRLPLLKYENAGELYQIWKKFTRPMSLKLSWLWAAHVALSFTITNSEAMSLFKIERKLSEMHNIEKEMKLLKGQQELHQANLERDRK